MKEKIIRIMIKSGMVQDVKGLPKGYLYEVIDYDCLEDNERAMIPWEKY